MASSNKINNKTTPKPILLLGAGELGLSLLTSLLAHPAYSPSLHPITLSLRPATLTNPPQELTDHLASLSPNTVTLLGLDLTAATTTVASLAAIFSGYECVIHASGMNLPPGTQRKVTDAVLEAGVDRYMPWQFGVDYDVLGPDAGAGLFAEQCGVREVLRGQYQHQDQHQDQTNTITRWMVVSCGIFMSFLVGQVWGVVERGGGRTDNRDNSQAAEAGTTTPTAATNTAPTRVRALGSWQDGITVTEVVDIARVTAELVLDGDHDALWEQNKVFIAGQTLSYEELAQVVEKVTGTQVMREPWDREFLTEQMRKNPGNKLWQYRVVFGGGKGVSWPQEGTWNHERGMVMEGVEEWLRRNWGEETKD